jgi:phytol kinase
MEFIDIIALIIVYIYVISVFIVSEKIIKNKYSFSRKFVHIMVGNMIFIMPLFSSSIIMVFYLTLPITIGAFFLSKYSPIKINNSITESGHGLGLVYYAGIWTILLFVFQDYLWVVALAIAPMVYGDGFASLIGEKYGKHKFFITKDLKSIEGSLAMFITTFLTSSFIWFFYAFLNYPIGEFNIFIILIISAIATVVEAITPKGLDNISVSSITAILYFLVTVIL